MRCAEQQSERKRERWRVRAIVVGVRGVVLAVVVLYSSKGSTATTMNAERATALSVPVLCPLASVLSESLIWRGTYGKRQSKSD